MWIKRTLFNTLTLDHELVQVLIGPRQCGKSSLIHHLDPEAVEFSMDDLSVRELAQRDPGLLLALHEGKAVFIDEAQLAPSLFPAIKRKVDLFKRAGKAKRTLFRITGSNQILMDKNVKESLAGRASFFELNTLSVHEILQSCQLPLLDILFKGGWPELYAYPETAPVHYLDNYISSYVEKDIILSAGIQKHNEFLRFIRLLAGRTAQILNLSELSKEVGVESSTIREWISVLQKMKLIALVEPYFSNLSKRLIKSPKVYFLDTGLACRLQGWRDSGALLTSPQFGGLFETLVFAEIHKFIQNHRLGWNLFYWRTRDQEEVDFLIQIKPKEFLFVEAKVTAQAPPDLKALPEIRKVFKTQIPKIILCHLEGENIVGNRVPIRSLASVLAVFVDSHC